MIEEDEVQVSVRDDERGRIIYTDGSGKETTYYLAMTTWFSVEDLRVCFVLGATGTDQKEPILRKVIRGTARLSDIDISVVGEPATRSKTLEMSFEAGDWRPKYKGEWDNTEPMSLREDTLGGAMLSFNRADFEIKSQNEWWSSCYVPKVLVDTLEAEINAARVQEVKVGLTLKGLYTDEPDYVPFSDPSHLFIRGGERSIPSMATGAVTGLNFSNKKLDLQIPEPIEPDFGDEEITTPKIIIDPVANAIAILGEKVDKFRGTVKWVGGIIIVVMLMSLSR